MHRFSFALAILAERKEALRAFWRDRKGTGAIEFAILAPLLIMTYVSSFEISLGFSVSRKVARASASVSDILTQQTSVDKATLDGMNDVVKSIMTPYALTNYSLKMTGIKVLAAGSGVVTWSRDQAKGTPYKPGDIVTVPTDISTTNTFIVRSELVVPHELLLFTMGLGANNASTINLSNTYYYRQRVGEEIKCSDC